MKYLDLMNHDLKETDIWFKDMQKYVDKEKEQLEKYYKKYYRFLSPFKRKLIEDYTENYYEEINSFFATEALYGENNHYEEVFNPIYIKLVKKDGIKLNKIISRALLPKDITVFRGTSYSDLRKSSIIENGTIRNLIIYSTSINPLIARKFGRLTSSNEFRSEYVILEIDLPKSYPALYIEPLTSTANEEEILLNNNSVFEIVDEEDFKDIYSKASKVKIIKLKPKI